MSDNVQFDTDIQTDAMRRQGPVAGFGQPMSESSGMTGWLVRHGWAKSANGAQTILVTVVVINIIITFVVIKYFIL